MSVISSCVKLGATPKFGNISFKPQETEYNTINISKNIITTLSGTEKVCDGTMVPKINENASNINCYDSSRTYGHIQVNSSLIYESKELESTYNRGDTLVHNTNNSNSCLFKHLALKCQVGAPYTAQNMVASLDLSTLDRSSDRFTTNFETYGTVAHESHNYVYSSLSYFSDISDHNSQVASKNKYEKSQANEFEDSNIGIQSNYVVGPGVTSELGRHSTGSEFSHTMCTQVIKCAEEHEHQKTFST